MVDKQNRPERRRARRGQTRPGFRRPKRSTAERIARQRPRWLSAEARQIFEAFRLAVEGDRSRYDRLAAEAMAMAYILSRRLSDEVMREDVVLTETTTYPSGATRKRPIAHPALKMILAFNKLLGFTAKDLGLTRRSRGKNDPHDPEAARRRRDEMLRAADKSGLPAPDPELFRSKPS